MSKYSVKYSVYLKGGPEWLHVSDIFFLLHEINSP